MHVQFEFTHDDLIDASRRFSARSKVVRSFQWKNLVTVASFSWLLAFSYFHRTPAKGAVIGLLAAGLSALVYPSSNRRGLNKRMHLLTRDLLGDANSFLCEVELRLDGVWIRSINRQTLYEWPGVEEIKDTSDSVDIFTRDGSGVVVRNRAFASPEERLRFIELARARLQSPLNAATIEPPISNVTLI